MNNQSIYYFYSSQILPRVSTIRGTYRLGEIIRYFFGPKVQRDEISKFIDYRGYKIRFADSSKFMEILRTDLIGGYKENQQLDKKDLVIDAGAYPGEFTVYAAKKVDKVLALEPDKSNAEKLRKTVELNNLDNVEILEKGLHDSEKEVPFHEEGDIGSEIDENSNNKIRTTSLDNLCSKKDIQPDFVKMDIEGAEIEAVRGAEKIIENVNPHFAIASYHDRDGEKTCVNLTKFFEERDIPNRTGFEPHLTTWAGGDLID